LTDIPFTEGFGQLYLPAYLQWAILLGILGVSIVLTYKSWRVFVNQTGGKVSHEAIRSPIGSGQLWSKYGLVQTSIAATAIKGSVFAIGILIIGVLEPRTILNSCPSIAPPLAVYQFAPWSHIEAYTDYRDIYLPCLIAPFLKGGANLYHLYGVTYNYPPLFLYLISGFAYIGNLVWLPAFPLVLFDVLTTIPLYLIARDFLFQGDTKLAFFVAAAWAANPIDLLYNDLMWLNMAPAVFFLVLAVYLFLRHQWMLSSLVLAISTGFKQTSVIIFPVLLIFMYKSLGFSKKLFAYIAIYFLSFVLISTPYIFTETQYYFWSLDFPVFGIPSNAPNVQQSFSTSFSAPVRITTIFGYLFAGSTKVISETYIYLSYLLIAVFAFMLIYLVVNPFPNLTSRRTANICFPRVGRIIKSIRNPAVNSMRFEITEVPPERVLEFCLAVSLMFLTFYGGGVYKYYFVGVTPLGILVFNKRTELIFFEALSIFLILVPREFTPWVALLFLLYLLKVLKPHQFEKSQCTE
jgi:hypothetical protein